jgi:hypothetical protein
VTFQPPETVAVRAAGHNISTATAEEEIDLAATHATLTQLDEKIRGATARHNAFLAELNLPPLPGVRLPD